MHGLGKFYWVDGRKYDGEVNLNSITVSIFLM